MKPQVQPAHYQQGYDSKARFCSYWTQIEYILKFAQSPVLEIGVGNGTVTDYLRRYGIAVVSLDLDPHLRPVVAANAMRLPFRDDSFAVGMACEVLEHLPFEQFPVCLRELWRVTRSHAVLSLPHAGKAWPVQVHLPGVGTYRRLVEVSWLRRPRISRAPAEHYWELELPEYPVHRVETVIRASGWQIVERQRLWENPYHQFYLLAKDRFR